MTKTVRILLLLVGMTAISAIAEAQCYQCRNLRPMPWYQGACIEGQIGFCSSQCCWQPYGTSCTLPDNDLWYCYSYPGGMAVADRYFTSRVPVQYHAIALTQKTGTFALYQRDLMRRNIPRRCPSSV